MKLRDVRQMTALAVSAMVAFMCLSPVGHAQFQPNCGQPEISGATLYAVTQVQPPIENGHCFKEYRVRSDVHMISSYRFGAGSGDDLTVFLSRDADWLRDSLADHVENQLGWVNGEELTYSGIVFADIEHAAHIMKIKGIDPNRLDLVGAQWALCIQILDETFPCAKIGWAPIHTPPSNGHTTPDPDLVDLIGYVLGTFDFSDLDYIAPNVYPKFWVGDQLCSQPALSTKEMVRDRYTDIATHSASALTAIIAEADLYDPTFSSRVTPVANLAYRIYNGGNPSAGCAPSNWDGRFLIESNLDPALEYTLLPQIDVFKSHGITHFSFWSSRAELADLDQGNPVHIDDYWRLISCEFDYDGNGQRDFYDYQEWYSYYVTNGLCADINGDGVVDSADASYASVMAGMGLCN